MTNPCHSAATYKNTTIEGMMKMNWLTKLRDGFKEKSAFSNARQKIDAVNNYIVRRPMMSPEANPLSYLEIAEELLTTEPLPAEGW